MKQRGLILLCIVLLAGCSHVISEQVRSEADKTIPLGVLFKNPDLFRGAVVILGGVIVTTENKQDGTYIEVVEQPLDYRGIPKPSDKTSGRFIIVHNDYLDPAIFSAGRYLSVAGEVIGRKVQPLGEINYSYLFLRSRELRQAEPSRGIPIHFGIGVSTSL